MENLSLFSDIQGEWIDLPQSRLYWAPNFFTAADSARYFSELSSHLNWQQLPIKMFGRTVLQPRLQAWHGEKEYAYSGLIMKPEPWNPTLLTIKHRCESELNCSFNSVLANMYRNGQDYMGWHQDNEKELGPQPIIASLTFGEQRRFILKHKFTHEKVEFDLKNGSLLVMTGKTQDYWLHSLPKTQRACQKRINLTYRHIIHPSNS